MNGEQSAAFFFSINISGLYISSGWFTILGQFSIQFLVQLSCKLDQSCRIQWEPKFQKSLSLRKKRRDAYFMNLLYFFNKKHILLYFGDLYIICHLSDFFFGCKSLCIVVKFFGNFHCKFKF